MTAELNPSGLFRSVAVDIFLSSSALEKQVSILTSAIETVPGNCFNVITAVGPSSEVERWCDD